MNNLNSLIIEGNLARDPEFREPTKDFKVCSFTVGVNRWYKTRKGTGEEEVSFFDVETYGRLAEVCYDKLRKGNGVRVVGRLKQSRWEDGDTGKSKSSVYVIAEHVEFKPVYQVSDKSGEKNADKSVEKKAENAVEKTAETNAKTTDSHAEENSTEQKEAVAVPQTQETVF